MQNSWWLAHLSKGEEVRVEMELIEMILASVYGPDAGSLSDRTLKGCVRSSCQTAQWLGLSTGRWLRPVKVDRTRPVEKTCLGELTGNDRTLGLQRPVSFTGASGQLRSR